MPDKQQKIDFAIIILPILAILSLVFLVFFQNKRLQIKDYTLIIDNNLETVKKRSQTTQKIDWIEAKKTFEKTKQKIDAIPGTYALYIIDPVTDIEFDYNPNTEFFGASLYKIPIAAATLKEVERGRLSLNTTIRYYPYDYATGTGVLNEQPVGTEFSVETLLRELIKTSDNVAQNILVRTIGEAKISEAFSTLKSKSTLDGFYNYNLTNTKDFAYLLKNLYYGSFLTESSRTYLVNIMYPTTFDDRISPYIGAGYTFHHKIGNWESSWHDCGYVMGDDKEVIVCLMSKETNYADFLKVAELTGDFVNLLF